MVLLGWSLLVERYYPRSGPVPAAESPLSPEAGIAPPEPKPAALPARDLPDFSGGGELTEAKGEEIALETDSVIARLTTSGGRIVSWKLKSHRATGATVLEDLVPLRAKLPKYLARIAGPLGVRLSDFPESAGWPAKASVRLRKGGAAAEGSRTWAREVEFIQSLPKERTLIKRIRLAESSHLADLEIELSGPMPEYLDVLWSPGVCFAPNEEEALNRQQTFWNVSAAVLLTRQDIVRRKEGKKPVTCEEPAPFWVSVHNKYFVAALMPVALDSAAGVAEVSGMVASAGRLETGGFFLAPKTKRPDDLLAGLRYKLDPKARRVKIPLQAYIGPQDYNVLRQVGSRLEKVIDFGFFGVIALPLMHVLNFLAGFVHNYGLAIILLTLLVKVVLWWPSQWGLKQMKGMQTIQPKVKFITEQFKDDPKRKQEEIMRLYREAGVNPAAGCLPMLLQIPIFFALYTVLRTSIELRGAPFMLWIQDLSAKDPYYVLPLTVGATMYLQQAMMPTVGDPQQAKMMRWFSLGFILIFINFPAGFMLYFLVQNITQIAQQWYTNRQPTAAAAGRT